MHKNTAIFLQVMVAFLALAVLFLMVRTPLTEGRARDLDLFHIYADPLILYGYAASIPFFIGLFQIFRLLGYVRQGKFGSPAPIKALRTLKICAFILAALIAGAGLYIRFNHHKDDDPAGFLALNSITFLISLFVGFTAEKLEKRKRNENA